MIVIETVGCPGRGECGMIRCGPRGKVLIMFSATGPLLDIVLVCSRIQIYIYTYKYWVLSFHRHRCLIIHHRPVNHVNDDNDNNDDNLIIAQYIGITGNCKMDEISTRSLWNSRKC